MKAEAAGTRGCYRTPMKAPLTVLLTCSLLASCTAVPHREGAPAGSRAPLECIAHDYVKLVLAIGLHDGDYVDAYYGPPEYRAQVEKEARGLDALADDARRLVATVEATDPEGPDELSRLRHRYLVTQLRSAAARIALLRGETMSFDEEAKALYDVHPPENDDAYFQERLDRLEALLPGSGPLVERYAAFKRNYVIPTDRLDAVFSAAIDEGRRRTARHVELPANESFRVEYVTDKSWSGYNWFQGDAQSLIQVNTDLPIYIDRAIDLASHEGYPGHHVYNALLEKHLVRDRGWVEFSVYPLFSPQSLIAEGTANFGIEVAFPGDSRLTFERDVLYPLAGLDPATAERYQAVQEEVAALSYAGNEAARRYLNGEIDAAAAARYLMKYALMPEARAQQRVRFIDQYRSYVINYNFGRDLVGGWVGREAGGDDPERIWEAFEALLSSPRLPADLR